MRIATATCTYWTFDKAGGFDQKSSKGFTTDTEAIWYSCDLDESKSGIVANRPVDFLSFWYPFNEKVPLGTKCG